MPAAKAKQWSASNFRLQIDGLDCSHVTTIDSFSVKRTTAERATGETRDHVPTPSQLDFPSLRVTLPAAHAQTWVDWHADFVVKGLNDASREKTGSLEFLAPSLKDVLARVDLHGLGIFRLAPLAAAGGRPAVPLVAADLYCERLELTLP